MNNIPLVSIIIPVYNSEEYLKETIVSAINQTWKNKEIIVVDDGSTDESLEVAKAFEGVPNFRIYATANCGACAARNFGFNVSKGDYIQYLDADDIISLNKVEKQIQLLQKLPENYITSCGWAKFHLLIEEALFVPQTVWQDLNPVDWLMTAWEGGGMMQTACGLLPEICNLKQDHGMRL